MLTASILSTVRDVMCDMTDKIRKLMSFCNICGASSIAKIQKVFVCLSKKFVFNQLIKFNFYLIKMCGAISQIHYRDKKNSEVNYEAKI